MNLFIKSFNIVKDCPFITLYFVLYLIALFLILPVMLSGKNIIFIMIIGVLLMLLTCAFIAGWFGMIKTSVMEYKENKTPEEKLEEAIKLKNNFFSSVAMYILPVIAGIITLTALLYGHSYLSDILFGKIDEVLNNLSRYANDPTAFKNYFISLPDSTWAMIFKKSIFSYVICSLLTLLFLYWAGGLYLNPKCSINPLYAIMEAIKTIFGKFIETLAIFALLIVVNFILMFLQAFFIENVIISFITMILRIYFATYIIVLIFDLYENRQKQPAVDCINRTDSIGQDGAIN